MDVRHLELLRELADRGSVTAVARALHRTPSAVSQQLKAAERTFGTALVEPSGRGVRLTDAGRVLAAAGGEVARAVARAEARWEAFRGDPVGTVSVAALPSAATFLLPGVLHELADLPIELEVTDVDVAEATYARLVADHDLVVAHTLVRPPGEEAGLLTVELAREPLDIAMAPGHRLAARTSVRPEDLVDEEWIGVPVGFPFDTVRLAVEEVTGRAMTMRQRVRDNRLVEALVAASDCVAVLPRFTTPQHEGGVALRPLVGIPTGRHVYATARPDRAERRAVRRVLDAFVRVGGVVGTG